MDLFKRHLHRYEDETAYLSALDKAVASAATHRCGVRVTLYRDGDIVIQATETIPFGATKIIEET